MINAVLVPVRTKFLGQLLPRMGQLEALRCAVNEARDPVSALSEIGQIAHRMSGVAETLGFPRIGQIAMAVDAQITAALAGRDQLELTWRGLEPLVEDLLDEMALHLDI